MTDMSDAPVIGLTVRTLPLRSSGRDRPNETLSRSYVTAVERAGGLPVLLPNGGAAAAYLDRVDGLLLTGGDDPHPHFFGEEPHPRIEQVDPRRDRFEIDLVLGARERGMPLLGVCRGVQLLNIACGGDIYQDIPSQTESEIAHTQLRLDDGAWHRIRIAPQSRLAAILGTTEASVNSFHHQACRRPGRGLVVSAESPDGLPEAVEDPARPCFLGVQWHPELEAEDGGALFAALVAAAREARSAASNPPRPAPAGR